MKRLSKEKGRLLRLELRKGLCGGEGRNCPIKKIGPSVIDFRVAGVN